MRGDDVQVRQLRPIVDQSLQPREQCQQAVNSNELYGHRQWREKRFGPRGRDPYACQKVAVVELDGRKLCRLHAGQVALDHLLKMAKEG